MIDGAPGIGMVWTGTRWTWPNADGSPVGPNDPGGPPPVPSTDIATNANQCIFWVQQAQGLVSDLTGFGILGGQAPLGSQEALVYVQNHGAALRDLLAAILASEQRIVELSATP